MKIAYMSDLHLEFGNQFLPTNTNNADILVLAGDIILAYDLIDQNPKRRKLYKRFFDHIAVQYPCILIVGGNHELYRWRAKEIETHGHYIDVIKDYLKKYPNIRFLEKEYIDLGDTRFIGSTLWTDFGNANPLVMEQCRVGMSDYQWHYKPDDTLLWHRQSMDVIRSAMDHKNIVMISHMAPSFLSVHKRFHGHVLNSAYATELFEFISDHPQIKLWFHGHMHHTNDYRIGGTRILSNPYGYAHVEVNIMFDRNALVEIEGDPRVTEVSEH